MDNAEDPPGCVPDADKVTPDMVGNYVLVKVHLPRGGEMVTTWVYSWKRDDSGESTINPYLTFMCTMLSLKMGK